MKGTVSESPLALRGARIRRAGRSDVEALVELAATTFREAYRAFDDPADINDHIARTFTPASFAAMVDDPSSSLFVADVHDRLVAYLQLKASEPPGCVSDPAAIELAKLYVRAEMIGTGLGAALMQTAHTEARQRGGETIWLLVYERNEHARAFYRRWGFVDVGTKEFHYAGRIFDDPVMCSPVRASAPDPAA